MSVAARLIRRRPAVVVVWVALTALLVPRAARLASLLDVGARIEGSESAVVEQLMAGPLASKEARTAVLVVSGLPSVEGPVGSGVLAQIASSLTDHPDVQEVYSYLDASDTLFRAAGGTATFAVVGLAPAGARPDEQVARLRAHTAELIKRLGPAHPGIVLRWTGEPALNVDLRTASSEDVRSAERRALPLTAAFLLLASGALAAALLPVAMGALTIPVTLGAAAMVTHLMPLSLILQSVVSMLGLGLGIDYALLMVGRFREGLAAGMGPERAAEVAARTAGRTILLSASTVALGFVALLFVPLDELRSIGIGGILVVTVSALLAVTLLPGALAWLGPRVDWGRVWKRDHRRNSERRWRRLGLWVTGHPWIALTVGAAPVLWLAAQALALRPGLPTGRWLPPTKESVAALDTLSDMGRAGVIQRIRLVVGMPEGTSVRRSAGWNALARLADSLSADQRVAEVRSAVSVARRAGMGRTALAFIPDAMQGLVTDDGRYALLNVIPREEVTASGAVALVRELRAEPRANGGVAGARLLVGGLPAFNADYQDAVAGRLGLVVPLVVGAILVALLAGFRSVLVAVKATALNLLSVAAAFGALVIVFQQGHGSGLFGVAEPLGEVFSSLPVVVFCVVFGLSMDYEVFLISRVAEARRAGADDREAIVTAMATTGPVITSAATVMLVVFAAFTLGDFLLTKLLGFALAVAVLLDATVVRMVVGPALLQLAGRYNWWPGDRLASPAPSVAGPIPIESGQVGQVLGSTERPLTDPSSRLAGVDAGASPAAAPPR